MKLRLARTIFMLASFMFVSLSRVPPSQAGILAPKKASDLVTLTPSGAGCVSALGVLLDTRVAADGTTAPFTVPAGQVLVLTGMEAIHIFATGIEYAALITDTPTQVLIFDTAIADNNDVANVSIPDVPVKVGLCLQVGGSGEGAIVHGFLAKDQ